MSEDSDKAARVAAGPAPMLPPPAPAPHDLLASGGRQSPSPAASRPALGEQDVRGASPHPTGSVATVASAGSLASLMLKDSGLHLVVVMVVAAGSGVAAASVIAIVNDLVGPSPRWTFQHFALFAGVSVVAGGVSRFLIHRLALHSLFRLRLALCRSIARVPLKSVETIGHARLMAALTEDVSSLSAAISQVPSLVIACATVVAALVHLAWLFPTAFGVMSLFLLLGILGSGLLQIFGESLLRKTREQVGLLFERMRSLIEGSKELRLGSSLRDAFLEQGVVETATRARGLALTSVALSIVGESWARVLLYGAIGGVIFVSLAGAQSGVAAGFILVLIFIMGPLEGIMAFLPVYGKARVAFANIREVGLVLERTASEAGPPRRATTESVTIELLGTLYHYRSEEDQRVFSLGPIDYSFRPGEITFIVGGNGSGKSTLGKVLTGLYEPAGGELRMNDELIDDKNRVWYREHFAAIFADYYLFDTLWGVDDPSLDERAAACIADMKLDHKVRFADGTFSTTSLSSGQRRRLALVSALLSPRPVYFFDEWASDQDPVFKHVFYERILPQLKKAGRTVIVVSHDDRYFHVADHLMKLEDGRLASDSTVQFMSRIRGSVRPPANPQRSTP